MKTEAETNDSAIQLRASQMYRTLARITRDSGTDRPLALALERVADLLHDDVIPVCEIMPVLAGAKRLAQVVRDLADVLTDEDPDDADHINETVRMHAIALDRWHRTT